MKIIQDVSVDHFIIDRNLEFNSIKFVNCKIKSVKIIGRNFGSLWFKDSVIHEGIEIIDSDVDIVQTDYAKLYKKILVQNSKVFMIDFAVHLDTSFSGKCTIENSEVETISLNSYGSEFEIINSKLSLTVDEYEAKNFKYHQENSTARLNLKNHSDYLIPEFQFIKVGNIDFTYVGKPLPKIVFQDCGRVDIELGKELFGAIDFLNIETIVFWSGKGAKIDTITVLNSRVLSLTFGAVVVDKIDIKSVEKSHIVLRRNAYVEFLGSENLNMVMFIVEDSKINLLKCKSFHVQKFLNLRNSEIKTMRVSEKLSKQQDSEMTQNNIENFKIELLQVRGMFYENLDYLVFDRE
ncbi:MAG: hypothetical protein ACKOAD_06325 [Gammaproteobacteria bacterium]